MRIRLVVTGRRYDRVSLPDQLELEEGASLAAALAAIQERLGESPLPPSCVLALDGEHLGTLGQFQDQPLRGGEELVLVAPVAGG